ncbi:TOG array regulator of axonemal microtubules protein 1-like [Gadus macrocephalus]|uniref:TOG array regulator of axonemal microtubules protein 1-like n=1 Tax=Gadus macrocephalus TaxID=80720 RepID=UPI0028CB4FCC|nr:TOG array regulator of axonemal microtubules protein 1-like [Gadus macrocephalus]
MADRESYTEMTRLVPAPPTEAKPPGLNPRYPCRARLPWLAAPAGGSNERIVLRPPAEAKPPGLNPRYPRGSRLPWLAAPPGGSNERIVLRPPTEAKPPALNPRYPRGARLPWLAVAEEADGQEAWITAAHSDTVSPRARALGAASSQGTSPGQTPPNEPAQGSLSGPQRDPPEPPGPHPFHKPELAMTQPHSHQLRELCGSERREEKMEGLMVLRSLAQNHVDTLLPRLRDVCLALVQEVKNLRSGVSRVAVCTLGVLYCHLQRAMDKEVDTTARALLHKAAESNAFIREEVDAALGHMVRHCTPARCINAFLDGGLSHLIAAVRKCAAQHLADLLERVGVARLLSGGKDVMDRILPAVVKLALDSSPEPRSFCRRMLLFLSSHWDFDSMLEKNIPTKDLSAARKRVSGLKAKGLGETPQTPASLPGSGTVRASTLQRKLPKPTSREPNSKYSSKPQGPIIDIRQLTALLESKDFRERIKGIDQLVADCQHKPSMVVRSLFPVFDAFRDRLQESNRKVNLYALEALQGMVRLLKEDLSGVLNHLVPAIVDNHLNSKNRAVYSAATGALCELVLNLGEDSSLLLEPFCFKAQVLSGQAKVDLIEKVAELVTELYPRRPQLVEQKALPLLWGLLGPSSGSVHRATTSLCRALHHQMGPGLRQSGASQPPSVGRDLNQLLRTMS